MNEQERVGTQEQAAGQTTMTQANGERAPERAQSNGSPANGSPTNGSPTNGSGNGYQRTGILAQSEVGQFRDRWDKIQRGFVDDPRVAAQRADELVTEAIRKLSAKFEEEHSKLEQQWSHNGEASTDDLRLALQRYRSFFQWLLEL